MVLDERLVVCGLAIKYYADCMNEATYPKDVERFESFLCHRMAVAVWLWNEMGVRADG